MAVVRRGDLDLYYEDLGGPEERTVVFLHGLLLSFEMMEPIARKFEAGFRPVLVELHGHGRSSRPADPASYNLEEFAHDLVAIADALGQERIGVFGTSLGADVALEAMMNHPDRIAGAVLEMPVLEHGARVASRLFKPIARALRSRRAPQALAMASRRLPSLRFAPGFPEALEHLAREPVTGAAVIEGLLEQATRHRWEDVAGCQVPALVIGHTLDPLHAFRDARELSMIHPNARLVRAYSILELRVRPQRLVKIASRFLARSFDEADARGRADGQGTASSG